MTFSIIIPVYNVAPFLRDCLDSVVSAVKRFEIECKSDAEVLCIDDGSTDGSAAILDDYMASCRVFHNPNAGVSAARNFGLSKANGEWLVFADSDDMVCEYWLADVYRIIAKEQPDIVRCNYDFAKDVPNGFAARRAPVDYKVLKDNAVRSWAWKTFFEEGFLWVTFVRRAIVAERLFRTYLRYKEDSVWLVEAVPCINTVCTCDFKGYFYRNSGPSLSRGGRRADECSCYLGVLKELWEKQQARARTEVERYALRSSLKLCAENDVFEWMCKRTSDEGVDEIRKAFNALRRAHAFAGTGMWNKRYRYPIRFWMMTGSDALIRIVDVAAKYGGWIKRTLNFRGHKRGGVS